MHQKHSRKTQEEAERSANDARTAHLPSSRPGFSAFYSLQPHPPGHTPQHDLLHHRHPPVPTRRRPRLRSRPASGPASLPVPLRAVGFNASLVSTVQLKGPLRASAIGRHWRADGDSCSAAFDSRWSRTRAPVCTLEPTRRYCESLARRCAVPRPLHLCISPPGPNAGQSLAVSFPLLIRGTPSSHQIGVVTLFNALAYSMRLRPALPLRHGVDLQLLFTAQISDQRSSLACFGLRQAPCHLDINE